MKRAEERKRGEGFTGREGPDVEKALKVFAKNVRRESPVSWGMELVNGRSFRASAELDDGWLLMWAKLSRPGPKGLYSAGQLWRMLCLNRGLPAGAKIAMDRKEGLLQSCLEMPLLAGGDSVEAQVLRGCRSLRAAHGIGLRRRKTGPGCAREPSGGAAGAPGDDAQDVPALCEASGWAGAARPDGTVAVRLDTPDGYAQATVECVRGGGVRAAVALEPGGGLREPARKALCLFLLESTRALRMVRAAAVESGENEPSLVLEVLCRAPAHPEELHHGLSALSCAHAHCSREAEALTRERLAAQYVGTRGWAP